MPIYDFFSKQQKRLRGEVPDVYTYGNLPPALRVQIVHIWYDVIGTSENYNANVGFAYKEIVKILRHERGVFQLPTKIELYNPDPILELTKYFLDEEDVEKSLDVVQITSRFIELYTSEPGYLNKFESKKIASEAIKEINQRFREHGIGFYYESGKIIRIDSEFIHSDVVKPALHLLSGKKFMGAQEEFLRAYDHYRHGNAKEALNECLKAFESTMKAICASHRWDYQPTDTAKRLIDICLEHDLIQTFWQAHFTALRSMLESGIPTGRNKLSGHGQGEEVTGVPGHLVAYMLHMTAASIVFLGESDKTIPCGL